MEIGIVAWNHITACKRKTDFVTKPNKDWHAINQLTNQIFPYFFPFFPFLYTDIPH